MWDVNGHLAILPRLQRLTRSRAVHGLVQQGQLIWRRKQSQWTWLFWFHWTQVRWKLSWEIILPWSMWTGSCGGHRVKLCFVIFADCIVLCYLVYFFVWFIFLLFFYLCLNQIKKSCSFGGELSCNLQGFPTSGQYFSTLGVWYKGRSKATIL